MMDRPKPGPLEVQRRRVETRCAFLALELQKLETLVTAGDRLERDEIDALEDGLNIVNAVAVRVLKVHGWAP